MALPLALVTGAKIFPDHGSYDAVNPNMNTAMLGLVTVQVLLYMMELFYRIQVHLSLILHHILTAVAMIVMYVLNRTYSDIMYKYGLVLQLLAFTEQPLYIVLLLRNLGFREWNPRRFTRVCRVAAYIFLVTRIIVTSLFISLIVQNVDNAPTTRAFPIVGTTVTQRWPSPSPMRS